MVLWGELEDGSTGWYAKKKKNNIEPVRSFNYYYYYFTCRLRQRYSKKRLATNSSMTVTLDLADWATLTSIANRYHFDSLSKAIKVCVKKYPLEA